MDGESNSGMILRSKNGKTTDFRLSGMADDPNQSDGGASDTLSASPGTVLSEICGSAGAASESNSTVGEIMTFMAAMMKENQAERREAERRRREDLDALREERRLEELARQEERQCQLKVREEERKIEEIARQEMAEARRMELAEEKAWREQRHIEKSMEMKISSALRSFPKISSTAALPTQLANYSALLSGLKAPQEVQIARLPEVLSGAAATTYQNLNASDCKTFADLKERFLVAAGITFSSAGKAFIKPDLEALRKLSSVDLWCHVKGLAQRLLAGAGDMEEGVSALCAVFLGVFGSNNLVLSLSGSAHLKEEEVQGALHKTYEAFGSVLGGNSSSVGKKPNQHRGNACDHCGKSGHKTDNCWSKPKGKSIVCFSCNKEGHIASKCPDKSDVNSDDKASTSVVKKKSWNKNSVVREPSVEPMLDDGMLTVRVGSKTLKVLPDSGAQVSVVPPDVVDESDYTGDTTCLVDFEGRGDRRRKVANVKVSVGDVSFIERVVVSDHLGDTGLLSLPIMNKERCDLILSEFYSQRKIPVRVVETRATVKAREEEIAREEKVLGEECVVVRDVRDDLSSKSEDESCILSELSEDCAEISKDMLLTSTCENVSVSKHLVSAVHDDSSACESANEPNSGELSADETGAKLAEGVAHTPLEPCGVPEAYELDCLKGGSESDVIRELTKSDPTLKVCRRLASQRERGYYWENGIVFHKYLDNLGEVIVRMVVPLDKRKLVCRVAHDKLGHLGHRKMRLALNRCFTWPLMGKDLESYVKSCTECQKSDKRGQRKVPLVERPLLSEPFEALAVDIVGPFPLARGRFRYLLTTCCLATRWPDVVPLKSITAKAVADGLVQIFGRCGLPYLLLCDNGSQFRGKLMSELTSILGVELRHSTPYHPEGNGMLERLHATLVAMIRKAVENKLDWADQVPFALFAMRQMPCRSTGMSPYELVWGKNMRTPLDVLYQGWRAKTGEGLQVSEWAEHLCDRLDILRDSAVAQASVESNKRKGAYDVGKCARSYDVGNSVWVRVAGKSSKLDDSWEGPFLVMRKLNEVNYCVGRKGSKKGRNVHVNLLKSYIDREKVMGVTVLAEEKEDVSTGARLAGDPDPVVLKEVEEVLKDFGDLLDGTPGSFKGEPMGIDIVEGSTPVCSKPYRIPEAIKPKVKDALDQLIDNGWVIEAPSPWASPIVPVSKPDGSIRLCVNYRKLNECTHQIQYPIPHFDDLLGDVGQAEVLSKLDLMKGYHQVPLSEEAQLLTGFVTPWGSYRYTVLPFGLKNAPALFQRLMSRVLDGCNTFALVYIDDILIHSKRKSCHSAHVRQVLEHIRESGLKLNPKKCVWARPSVEFLGHVIGRGCVSVPEARVVALRNFKKPVTRRDMRAALGCFGYYRRFIKDFAHHSFVLSPSTSTNAPGKVKWTPDMDSAFVDLCKSICDVCALYVPCSNDVFVLHTDASGRGVGAVLYVVRAEEELPVAFYSRQLRGAEMRYSATELEALAVVSAIEHFIPYLYGRHFQVMTDHAPLCGLMTSPTLNRRLRGFMLRLLEFDVTITYRPGVDNGDADGLSRQAWERPEDEKELSVDVPRAVEPQHSPSKGGCGNAHPVKPHLRKEE